MADIELGKRLKNAREQAKMTQQQVCSALNIEKVQTLSAYETGKNSPPIDKLKQLITLYKADTHWILFGEHQKDDCSSPISDVEGFIRTINSFASAFDYEQFREPLLTGLSITVSFGYSSIQAYNKTERYKNMRKEKFCSFLEKMMKLSKAYTGNAIDDDDYSILLAKNISVLGNQFESIDTEQAIEEDSQLPF